MTEAEVLTDTESSISSSLSLLLLLVHDRRIKALRILLGTTRLEGTARDLVEGGGATEISFRRVGATYNPATVISFCILGGVAVAAARSVLRTGATKICLLLGGEGETTVLAKRAEAAVGVAATASVPVLLLCLS